MRKMMMRAIGLRGARTLPPSACEDLLKKLGVPDWTDLYDPDAVLWNHDRALPLQQHTKAHDYAVEHLVEEIGDTRYTINALLHGRKFPVDEAWDEEHEFLHRALAFFKTDSVQKALQDFLTEQHNGQLAWVKPLQEHMRQDLLHVLGSAKPIHLEAKDQDTMVDILKDHEMYILSSILHERSR